MNYFIRIILLKVVIGQLSQNISVHTYSEGVNGNQGLF